MPSIANSTPNKRLIPRPILEEFRRLISKNLRFIIFGFYNSLISPNIGNPKRLSLDIYWKLVSL